MQEWPEVFVQVVIVIEQGPVHVGRDQTDVWLSSENWRLERRFGYLGHPGIIPCRIWAAARPAADHADTLIGLVRSTAPGPEITGLASSLFLRSGNSRVIIARVAGSKPLRYELPIGERLPPHFGAGKVLAAQLDGEELDELIEAVTPFATASGREVTAPQLRR
jgi:DNA-binding IclR family transcriptional regulator